MLLVTLKSCSSETHFLWDILTFTYMNAYP